MLNFIVLIFLILAVSFCQADKKEIIFPGFEHNYVNSQKYPFTVNLENASEGYSYKLSFFQNHPECILMTDCRNTDASFVMTKTDSKSAIIMPLGEYYAILDIQSSEFIPYSVTESNLRVYFGYSFQKNNSGQIEYIENQDMKCHKFSFQETFGSQTYLSCPKLKIQNITKNQIRFVLGNQRQVDGRVTLKLWANRELTPLIVLFFGPVGYSKEMEIVN